MKLTTEENEDPENDGLIVNFLRKVEQFHEAQQELFAEKYLEQQEDFQNKISEFTEAYDGKIKQLEAIIATMQEKEKEKYEE